MPARITSDSQDRKVLREKLAISIDPLSLEHLEALVNIVTGNVVNHTKVNVDNAVNLGTQQSFENRWPNSFHEAIHHTVHTMASAQKHIKVGDSKAFDTEVIYARAMGLQSSNRIQDTKKLMSHELSPYPPSMFDEKMHIREAKSKSALKNSLKVETSMRHKEVDAIFIDGCASLWVVPWPVGGKIQDFLNNVRHQLDSYLQKSEVYLIFDRLAKSIYM